MDNSNTDGEDTDELAGYKNRLNQLKSIKDQNAKDPGILASTRKAPVKVAAPPSKTVAPATASQPKSSTEATLDHDLKAQTASIVSEGQNVAGDSSDVNKTGESDEGELGQDESWQDQAQEAQDSEDSGTEEAVAPGVNPEEENDEQVERTLDDLVSERKQEQSDPSPGIPRINTYSKISQPSPGAFAYNRNRQSYHGLSTGSRVNKIHLIILSLLGVVVIGSTVYLLKSGYFFSKEAAPSPSPQATPASTPTPQPTLAPVLDIERSKFKIRVLNGTGKSGFAASASAKLKGLGFQTEKVANASNSAFTQTVVRAKASAQGLGMQLIKDLAPDFNATSSGNLKENDAADGEVILGQK